MSAGPTWRYFEGWRENYAGTTTKWAGASRARYELPNFDWQGKRLDYTLRHDGSASLAAKLGSGGDVLYAMTFDKRQQLETWDTGRTSGTEARYDWDAAGNPASSGDGYDGELYSANGLNEIQPLSGGAFAYDASNPIRFGLSAYADSDVSTRRARLGTTQYTDEDEARRRGDGEAAGFAPGLPGVEEAGAPRAPTKQTGLVYYGLRFYNPELGRLVRFASDRSCRPAGSEVNRDPIRLRVGCSDGSVANGEGGSERLGQSTLRASPRQVVEEGGANLYRFVDNDPSTRLDALGLKCSFIEPDESSDGTRAVFVTCDTQEEMDNLLRFARDRESEDGIERVISDGRVHAGVNGEIEHLRYYQGSLVTARDAGGGYTEIVSDFGSGRGVSAWSGDADGIGRLGVEGDTSAGPLQDSLGEPLYLSDLENTVAGMLEASGDFRGDVSPAPRQTPIGLEDSPFGSGLAWVRGEERVRSFGPSRADVSAAVRRGQNQAARRAAVAGAAVGAAAAAPVAIPFLANATGNAALSASARYQLFRSSGAGRDLIKLYLAISTGAGFSTGLQNGSFPSPPTNFGGHLSSEIENVLGIQNPYAAAGQYAGASIHRAGEATVAIWNRQFGNRND